MEEVVVAGGHPRTLRLPSRREAVSEETSRMVSEAAVAVVAAAEVRCSWVLVHCCPVTFSNNNNNNISLRGA